MTETTHTTVHALGTFSYLPPFTEEDVAAQVASILGRGLVPAIEFTTEPAPRNRLWSMWKLPLFDATSPDEVLAEIAACVRANPKAFVKLNGYDPTRQGQVASFVVRRPS